MGAESFMVETGVSSEDELILAMQEELEGALAEEGHPNAEREMRKKAMISILAASVRTQRLYFVVRSAIMSLISAAITFTIVGYLGSIGVVEAVLLGIVLFVASLVVSRLFDRQIVKLSKKIVSVLSRHKRASEFVLENL
jgi:ABC-type transport system involved in cytochrome bd biosynthesis fused ATPase/permease subunit